MTKLTNRALSIFEMKGNLLRRGAEWRYDGQFLCFLLLVFGCKSG